jgi:hypothetical protein
MVTIVTAEPDSEIRDTALREPDPAPSRTGRRDVMKLEGTRARRALADSGIHYTVESSLYRFTATGTEVRYSFY